MKKVAITFLLMFIWLSSFSQHLSIGGRLGLGSYSMGDLKYLQEFRIKESELPLLTTNDYPITPNYRIEIAIDDLKYITKVGLFYTFNSTGARSTRSDYSGRVDLDAILNGNQIGLTLQKNLLINNSISYGLYFDGSYIMSLLEIKDNLKINSDPKIIQEYKYKFNSFGAAAEIGVVANYRLNPIKLQLNMGYLFDFSGKLFLDGDNDQWLALENSPLKTNWAGFRIGLQISICPQKSKKRN
jgi:hypothetical protein